ncbi:MAG: helix-turn-helix domain-containing protein [Bacillota bacterium]
MGYKSIGRQLQLAREEAGLSQEQLAARVGCSQSTLSNYEKGKRRIYLAQLERIAEVLQRPIDYFMQPPSEQESVAAGELGPDSTDIKAMLEALEKLSPVQRKLAVDFVIWLSQRGREIND